MKALILILAITLTSCTTSIQSPLTGIQYTGKINKEGLSIIAKPPFYDSIVELYKYITTPSNQ
jgi:hypothetical protein